MGTTSGSNLSEVRAVPSVSKDRWLNHAQKKLDKGYSLIVSEGRKTANFYRPGSGYETCQHKTALLLIKQGIVKKAGKHHLGTVYSLSAKGATVAHVPPEAEADDDDTPIEAPESDYEDILDELESTDDDEEAEQDDDS